MLIKALCDYSDKLSGKDTDSIPEGFSKQNVSFEILLTDQGDIADIIDIRSSKEVTQKNGKPKPVYEPYQVILPERSQKTSIFSNIIEHRPLYIFGLNPDSDKFTTTDKTGKAEKSHNAFVSRNLDFFENLDSRICRAYYNFIKKWTRENETSNTHLINKVGKQYSNSYFCFGLDGQADIRLEEDKLFKEKYMDFLQNEYQNDANVSSEESVCAISGEKLPIARIHDKIKFPGGNTTGCVLVGMKESAYESYGKTQSYNSNISEIAMKKYTSTLNKLLSDKNHYIIIDDMVIIYFAMKKDDTAECNIFSSLFNFDNSDKEEDNISKILQDVKYGISADLSQTRVDTDVSFYICGLTPNSSRICQKFIYHDKFGNLIKNIIQHQIDMRISENERQIYFSSIMKELISPKSKKDKVAPPLVTSIMLAAFNNSVYPNALLENIIRRIKTDSDDDKNRFIKLNNTRVGIIKACLNRKSRFSKNREEITMVLDSKNNNSAYLCGRLFAVLEKIQLDSSGGNLNKTIKDSFFSTACSRPSAVFPKLIYLSQNHLKKLTDSSNIYYQKLIGEISDNLPGAFPQTLNLDSQGAFIVGYYQQNKSLYTKNEKSNKKEGN